MKQQERLNYLLEYLKKTSQYKNLKIENNYETKKLALRAFMNIRMPQDISTSFLQIQDDFLRENALEKGIVELKNIPTIKEEYNSSHVFANKISVWQGDITRLKVDAIVNAANSQMLGCFIPCHKCIDNAIHSAAGLQLRAECNYIMEQRRISYGKHYEEPTGTATLTKGYNLPSKYVIHTVGPIVNDKLNNLLRLELQNCYESVLKCSIENGIQSIAFCCISTGEFHFPNDEAAKIAINTVSNFLEKENDKINRIIFNVFKNEDKYIYLKLLQE